MPHIPSHRFGAPNPIDPGFNVPAPIRPPIPQTPGLIGQPTPGQGSPSPGFPGTGGGGNSSPFGPNFLRDLLEEEQRLPFFNQVNQLGGTNTPIGRFFNTQFSNFQNEFLGRQGAAIQGNINAGANEFPELRFADFLGNVDFQKRFRSLAPSLRGQGGQARFRPPTQFQF